MTPGQLLRTWTLLETLLDYLPGPSMIRSAADTLPQSGDARATTYSPAERDRQIAHLEQQARLRRGDYRRGSEPWEAARREQYRVGDYQALDHRLADLRVINAQRHDLAWRVATHHPGLLDMELRVELVRTIQWLAERLPDPVRLPTWATRSAPPSVADLLALRDLGVPLAVMVRVYGKHAAALSRRARKATA